MKRIPIHIFNEKKVKVKVLNLIPLSALLN